MHFCVIKESVRAFKEKMKLGRFAEKDPEEDKRREKEEEELAQSISIGSRCEVSIPKATAKRGVVMFVGTCQQCYDNTIVIITYKLYIYIYIYIM